MMSLDLRGKVKEILTKALSEDRVLWRPADLGAYTSDASKIMPEDRDRHFPDMVVLPKTTAEVVAIVRAASEHRIPLIPKGGGSNRTGMTVPIDGGIVVDTIKMDRVVEVSIPDLYATIQPGITLKELDGQLAAYGLTLTQEQGSSKVATVGGSISTAGFSRKHQKYGTISDRIMSLEVVLPDGRVLRTGPKVLYTSTGYRLHQLFVGAEGTLGVITEATLRVEPVPESTDALLAFYDDFWNAYEAGLTLTGSCVTFVGAGVSEPSDPASHGAPPGKEGALSVSFEGTKGEVEAEMEYAERIVRETGGILGRRDEAKDLIDHFAMEWCGDRALRELDDEATAYVPAMRVREFFERVWNGIMPKYGMRPVPGNRHSLDIGRYGMTYCRFYIPPGKDGWGDYRKALSEVAELATSLGGSISSCTGVGLKNRDDLRMEYSDVALETMWKIKEALDPFGIMNPGKKLPARGGQVVKDIV